MASRLAQVRARIEEAAARAGRSDRVTLVAVSKTFPAERVREAHDAGQRAFGENRVQEGIWKIDSLAGDLQDVRWHLIGHLQTNKAKLAARSFDVVESVDSLRLARLLDAARDPELGKLPVLLEINVGGEASKAGYDPETFSAELPEIARLPNLELRGLMTVAPYADDPEHVRWVFRRLREMRDDVCETRAIENMRELSMGMSHDYEVAIEEGATMVRIGRAIFGERSGGRK
jgi:pyridoxal phosphate enzyme (YggS family)